MEHYGQRVRSALAALEDAEYILIGGGSGLSAAAGLDYSGPRFTENFADFIEKYGLTDMYSASFYPFPTQEELWAHWARHIAVNRFDQGATELYQRLLELVDGMGKEYFVITTNVESQFEKAGFPRSRIFEVQGNYAYLQCAAGCHDRLYYDEEIVRRMLARTRDCRIPSELIPTCPVCGGPMDVNLRKDGNFVQDDAWYEAEGHYRAFLRRAAKGRLVLLELGVGFNTPGIIRYPFEQLTYQNPQATLIRVNRDYPQAMRENCARTIPFDEDMGDVVSALGKR